MRTRRRSVHSPGLLRLMIDRLRGREQHLIRGAESWPLLLASFPRGESAVMEELSDAWLHTLPSLQSEVVKPYIDMLSLLPSMVVVLLRPKNVCTCLGHHHPKGTESRLTRRLAADTGSTVGEIDLAYEAIRTWQPHPIASLAASESHSAFDELHFRSALLTILLHELEHLAYPDRAEKDVRRSSDEFYTQVLEELLASDRVLP